MGFQVLPGDTIAVWDQMFGAVDYFNPSGRLLRERRIDLGAVIVAVRTDERVPGESVHQPLPDGSFLMEVYRSDWQPPEEAGAIYRQPTGYVRVDTSYTTYSFGWWRDYERFWWPDQRYRSRQGPLRSPVGTRQLSTSRTEITTRSTSSRPPARCGGSSGGGSIRSRYRTRNSRNGRYSQRRRIQASTGVAGSVGRTDFCRRHYQAKMVLRVDAAGYLWAYDGGRREWSVFNPEGRWMGTVVLPETGVIWIGEGAIFGSRSDVDTGVQTVERYRLNRRGIR